MKLKNIFLSNKTVLAPLTDFSNHAFRILCRKYEAALVFTQMFNINALVNNLKKFESDLEISPDERPIVIQLIGNNPKMMTKAMDLLESYSYEGFDLNLGCPSPDAIRTGVGGALLQTPKTIRPLLRAMLNATNKAVSTKIRTGFNYFSINALEVAKLVEEEGVDFLTVHGRTVEAQYSGETNLDLIRKVKDNVEIPIVGNGDVVDGPSAERMLNYTNCDLIMIGRAAMENPRIFLEINNYLNRRTRIQKNVR